MDVKNTLNLKIGGENKTIYFGIVSNEEEKEQVFKLRFDVYSKKGYIIPENFPSKKESDYYDENNLSTYFAAKMDGKVVALARVIKDNVLPTEKYFDFPEPQKMKKINKEDRRELGRLIVSPVSVNGEYMPRHIIMLFLFKTLLDWANENNIKGGYAFIKSKLYNKLNKLKIPFWEIKYSSRNIPRGDILFNYFNNEEDPVIPIYFLVGEVNKKIKKMVGSAIFKKKAGNAYFLRKKIYKFFLFLSKIL